MGLAVLLKRLGGAYFAVDGKIIALFVLDVEVNRPGAAKLFAVGYFSVF